MGMAMGTTQNQISNGVFNHSLVTEYNHDRATRSRCKRVNIDNFLRKQYKSALTAP
jgi:hypothetical protein